MTVEAQDGVLGVYILKHISEASKSARVESLVRIHGGRCSQRAASPSTSTGLTSTYVPRRLRSLEFLAAQELQIVALMLIDPIVPAYAWI